jgi:hypothetical protein
MLSWSRCCCAVDIDADVGNYSDDNKEGWDGGDGNYDTREDGRRQKHALFLKSKSNPLRKP